MSYGNTWPAPDPNELHIESVIVLDGNPGGTIYHYVMKGDRALWGRYTFKSIVRCWREA